VPKGREDICNSWERREIGGCWPRRRAEVRDREGCGGGARRIGGKERTWRELRGYKVTCGSRRGRFVSGFDQFAGLTKFVTDTDEE